MAGFKVDNTDRRSLPKIYSPLETERKWQEYWKRPDVYKAAYQFNPDDHERPVFSIDTPPPFTSGEMHIGQAYWTVINDTIARYKRMKGFNVLLPQGWDCQGLPTELKVQNRWNIPRDNRILFRQKCIEWTNNMINQMKATMIKMGYRPDWEQFEYRTMDPEYWRIVQETLLVLYEKGLIYRGQFPVHWCPKCETALAQAEVGYEEAQGTLYYIRFPCSTGLLEVATTRPELLGACQALLVNPEDERYRGIIGTSVEVPIYGYNVPVLSDSQVDVSFGTGVVMVCTFGDEQDIRWQNKFKLPIKKIIDEQGRLVNSGKYDRLRVTDARKRIAIDLEALGLLSKREEITHKVLAHTERSDCLSPIEFLVKTQFFIRSMPYREKIISACREMRWIPEHMLQRLIDWVESISWDWLISRQRVYGTPIPFWFCEDCNEIIPPKKEDLPVMPENKPPPANSCPKCGSKNIKPSLDVCDCWVDSSITPLVTSGYFSDKLRYQRLYPASLRQQGHDIIRTWLFYTVLRCIILADNKPFKEVLVNGHILGPDGTKMSKSKGNVVNPEEGLKEFGADAMRQALLSITMGSDFPFKWETVRHSKGFLQKYWSSARFSEQFLREYNPSPEHVGTLKSLDYWILGHLSETINTVTEAMDRYQFHLALESLQRFFWHKFCDHYLEAVKHRLYSPKDNNAALAAKYTLQTVLWNSTLMLAPFCPHITEEVYNSVFRAPKITVHASSWPSAENIPSDAEAKAKGELLIELIASIRNEKSRAGFPLNAPLNFVSVKCPKKYFDVAMEEEQEIKSILRVRELTLEQGDKLTIAIS
jgi:valyl-tRNA synthetase